MHCSMSLLAVWFAETLGRNQPKSYDSTIRHSYSADGNCTFSKLCDTNKSIVGFVETKTEEVIVIIRRVQKGEIIKGPYLFIGRKKIKEIRFCII